MGGAITPLPQYAYMASFSIKSTGKILPLLLSLCKLHIQRNFVKVLGRIFQMVLILLLMVCFLGDHRLYHILRLGRKFISISERIEESALVKLHMNKELISL
jgi:hypothetical protein